MDEARLDSTMSDQLESALDVRAAALLPGLRGDLIRLSDDFERRFYHICNQYGDALAIESVCADAETNLGAVGERFRAALMRNRLIIPER